MTVSAQKFQENLEQERVRTRALFTPNVCAFAVFTALGNRRRTYLGLEASAMFARISHKTFPPVVRWRRTGQPVC